MPLASSSSRRQLRPRLLRRHVRGVPVRPVRVALSGALLVLAMRSFGTTKSARQVAYGAERRHTGVDAPGQSRCDLLQQPTVAVRVAERGERTVAAMIRIGTANRAVRAEMEDLTYLDSSFH